MAKFSMNCDGSSTKSHQTLVPLRLSKRLLANMPCREMAELVQECLHFAECQQGWLLSRSVWSGSSPRSRADAHFRPAVDPLSLNSVIHAPPCFPLRDGSRHRTQPDTTRLCRTHLVGLHVGMVHGISLFSFEGDAIIVCWRVRRRRR